jgi:hypothetical protein
MKTENGRCVRLFGLGALGSRNARGDDSDLGQTRLKPAYGAAYSCTGDSVTHGKLSFPYDLLIRDLLAVYATIQSTNKATRWLMRPPQSDDV